MATVYNAEQDEMVDFDFNNQEHIEEMLSDRQLLWQVADNLGCSDLLLKELMTIDIALTPNQRYEEALNEEQEHVLRNALQRHKEYALEDDNGLYFMYCNEEFYI